MLNAMSNFLTLGLSQFAEDFTAEDREHAVSVALFDAYSEDHIQFSIDEGSLIAKWWDLVTLTPEKMPRTRLGLFLGRAVAKNIASR